MPINVELLERVKRHILEEPRRYDQQVYRRNSTEAPCGTAACIAGWAVLLEDVDTCGAGGKDCVCATASKARDLLRLSDEEARTLFDPQGGNWPARFRTELRVGLEERDKSRQVRAAAAYIDWIIATGNVID